jgi:hypothetical protein
VSTIPFLQTSFEFLTARNGANDQERLCPRRNGIGQGRIRWFMRQVLPASEESHEWAALLSNMIANRTPQRGIRGLKGVENRALRDLTGNLKLHLPAGARQGSQMRGKNYPDHHSV